MNGFKPTGYGPKAGFVFSAKQGFTGSTGAYTNVQPYVRRKAFADGGFVRQDTPRMKEETIGDQGSGMVRRAKSYCALDQESGGKSPLRPGYEKGGMAKMKKGKDPNPMMKKGAKQQGMFPPKPMKKANGGAVSMSALSQVGRMRKRAKPQAPASMAKEKFAADGGRVFGSSSKGFASDVRKTGEFIGEIPRMVTDAMKSKMRRTQDDVADSKRRRIDSIADGTNTASNYARGGRMKKSGMTKC